MTVSQAPQIDENTLVDLGVMAKLWSAGNVKTRLGISIGMQQAALIHREFCLFLGQQLRFACDRRSMVVSPPDSMATFREFLPDEWDIQAQVSGDLGDRMKHWFKCSENRRILIGADCPMIDPAMVHQAAQGLCDHDLVLGPANDGGYYLVGVAGSWSSAHDCLMQDMPWSSDRVFDITCQRASEAGLTWKTLPPMEDIDTVAELNHLREQLRTAAPDSSYARLAEAIERVLEATHPVRPKE